MIFPATRLALSGERFMVRYRLAAATEAEADCGGIVAGTEEPAGHLKPVFPIPAGGMTLSRLPEMLQFYGPDTIFLIAGGLYSRGPDLLASSREYRQSIERLTRR